MNRIRKFCFASLLTLTLALSTFAGDIDCGVVVPPPPSQQTAAVEGNMATGVTTSAETLSAEASFVDPMTELTLDILQSILTLF
jgi:hypothetical protein